MEQLRDAMRRCFQYDGPYQLSSGRQSNYYYDGKLGTLDPAFAWHVGSLIADVIVGSGAEAVGGLELGAIPIADATGIAAHLRGHALPTFIVRKAPKQHGTRSQLAEAYVDDGPLIREQRRVAIVDDVITTGGSIRKAIEVVQSLGAVVTVVVALVERHESEGRALRDLGIPILAMFTTDEAGTLSINDEFVRRAEAASGSALSR